MKHGEIYWCNLHNEGHLQTGCRPCILLSYRDDIATIIPLSGSIKRLDMKTHILLKTHLRKPTMAIVEQLTTINRTDIGEYETDAVKEDMENIHSVVSKYLKLN